jgi:hypothetical protein
VNLSENTFSYFDAFFAENSGSQIYFHQGDQMSLEKKAQRVTQPVYAPRGRFIHTYIHTHIQQQHFLCKILFFAIYLPQMHNNNANKFTNNCTAMYKIPDTIHPVRDSKQRSSVPNEETLTVCTTPPEPLCTIFLAFVP